MSKYNSDNLIPAMRLFVKARRAALESGFTDNGGAIHSVERIANILGTRIVYPGMGHINSYKNYSEAEFSRAAWDAYQRGEKVQIEHVAPVRAWSREICDMIEDGATDAEVEQYVADSYRLVLLTPEERQAVDRRNRSKMCPERLAGIEFVRADMVSPHRQIDREEIDMHDTRHPTRHIQHGIEIDGQRYSSTWQAWKAMNLGSSSSCIKWRTAFKLSVDHQTGIKKYVEFPDGRFRHAMLIDPRA